MNTAINPMPRFGSRSWRICSWLCASLILGLGSIQVLTAILDGNPLWYYNMTIILFGFTLLGLVLLVKEGGTTLSNIRKYGLHPELTEADYLEFLHLTTQASIDDDVTSTGDSKRA